MHERRTSAARIQGPARAAACTRCMRSFQQQPSSPQGLWLGLQTLAALASARLSPPSLSSASASAPVPGVASLTASTATTPPAALLLPRSSSKRAYDSNDESGKFNESMSTRDKSGRATDGNGSKLDETATAPAQLDHPRSRARVQARALHHYILEIWTDVRDV